MISSWWLVNAQDIGGAPLGLRWLCGEGIERNRMWEWKTPPTFPRSRYRYRSLISTLERFPIAS